MLFDSSFHHFCVITGLDALHPASRGMSFSELNTDLLQCQGAGKWFTLVNSRAHLQRAVCDVFGLPYGVFIIHAYYFHPEDADLNFPEAPEAINHQLVYNAGTRVLFLYPEARHPHVCAAHMP